MRLSEFLRYAKNYNLRPVPWKGPYDDATLKSVLVDAQMHIQGIVTGLQRMGWDKEEIRKYEHSLKATINTLQKLSEPLKGLSMRFQHTKV